MSGGSLATTHGRRLEEFMRLAISGKPYVVLNHKQRAVLRERGTSELTTVTGGQPFFSTNLTVADIKSIYEVPWCLDVFAWHPTKLPHGLAVETKWQSTNGSTDDKLVFSVLSLHHVVTYYVEVAALMMDTAGIRDCVRNWVRRECRARAIPLFESSSAWQMWADAHL